MLFSDLSETEYENQFSLELAYRTLQREKEEEIFKQRLKDHPQVWVVEVKTQLGFPMNSIDYLTYAVCTSSEKAEALARKTSLMSRILVRPFIRQYRILDEALLD